MQVQKHDSLNIAITVMRYGHVQAHKQQDVDFDWYILSSTYYYKGSKTIQIKKGS